MTLLELLQHSPAWLATCAGVLGLLIGSFLNVVIHRLPIMMERQFRHECSLLDQPADSTPARTPTYNLVVPRSACPHCKHPIGALENIPVLSYLALRGRCRQCSAPISARYPLVELCTGLLSTFVALHFGATLTGVGALLLLWALTALFWIDADTYLLPDSLTLPLLWTGLAFNLAGAFVPLGSAVLGAMAGYLILWSIYWLFKLVTGKEGMGYGDFKLLAALGAWLGWQVLPLIVLLSSLVGAALGIAMVLLARRGWGKPLPYGPYLAVAGFISLIWGPALTAWYMGAH